MQIEWTEDLSVGVDEIDEQHKELFKRINKLDSALRKGKAKAEVLKFLEFLEEYAVTHFKTEEEFMVSCRYPEYSLHKTNHDRFKKDLAVIEKKFEAGAPLVDVMGLCNNLLIVWFCNHIRTRDMALGGFMKTRRYRA